MNLRKEAGAGRADSGELYRYLPTGITIFRDEQQLLTGRIGRKSLLTSVWNPNILNTNVVQRSGALYPAREADS